MPASNINTINGLLHSPSRAIRICITNPIVATAQNMYRRWWSDSEQAFKLWYMQYQLYYYSFFPKLHSYDDSSLGYSVHFLNHKHKHAHFQPTSIYAPLPLIKHQKPCSPKPYVAAPPHYTQNLNIDVKGQFKVNKNSITREEINKFMQFMKYFCVHAVIARSEVQFLDSVCRSPNTN